MPGKLKSLFTVLITIVMLSLAGTVMAQSQSKLKINPSSNSVKLATPVEIIFESPADYDAFAAGTLKLSLTLRNTLSDKRGGSGHMRFDPIMLREGFRQSTTDKSKITIWVVVENVSAPLAEAACVEARPGAERLPDGSGVGITLDYAACGNGSAQEDSSTASQRPSQSTGRIAAKGGKGGKKGETTHGGTPFGTFVVESGKNPGGDIRIVAGSTQSGPEAGSAAMTRGPNMIVMKGSGSPKQQGW